MTYRTTAPVGAYADLRVNRVQNARCTNRIAVTVDRSTYLSVDLLRPCAPRVVLGSYSYTACKSTATVRGSPMIMWSTNVARGYIVIIFTCDTATSTVRTSGSSAQRRTIVNTMHAHRKQR
jgi:hypothetical protein